MKKRFPHKEKILLVNITRLGDMLQATPTIAGMKLENPKCHIAVLVEKQFAEVCKHIPGIDEVIAIDLSMVVRALAREQDGIVDAYEYLTSIIDDLRSKQFDYCLNMSSSAYTALLLNLIGIKHNGGWTADDDGYRRIESDWAKLFASSVFHQNRQYNSLNLVDVFRCSADVEKHPESLLIKVDEEAASFAKEFIKDAGFTNTGPVVAVQAGASQGKRQWAPKKFAEYCSAIIKDCNARVVLTGTSKEMNILQPIADEVNSSNLVIAAGKTSIPQLAGLIKEAQILITGDTGTMHISAAVGTPVISMFVASAYGYETGPYGQGHIVIQPVIGCGPCNPNKSCARPDCHDSIKPQILAKLTALRLQGDFKILPDELVNPSQAIIYRSCFDEHGFCNLEYMSPKYFDPFKKFRDAYRCLWLDDLGDLESKVEKEVTSKPSLLSMADESIAGLEKIISAAEEGEKLIELLSKLILDPKAGGESLNQTSDELTHIDRIIEELGFHYGPLGPLTRMFVFAKENISGSDALALASDMGGVYTALARRARKLSHYYT